MQNPECRRQKDPKKRSDDARSLELYEVLIECRDEDEQRELFERLRAEGRKVKLLVL